jgi:polyhydroxybutyrate depolymerase
MVARWLAMCLLVVAVAGCRAPESGSAVVRGSGTGTVTLDGVARTYRLYVPDVDPAGPVPLVVMLHGGFGSGDQAERAYGWNAEADRSGFVVAYPEGSGRAWSVGAGCCGEPGRAGTDDVAVIEAIVAHIGESLPIDPDRIYAAGMSNGAMLSYRLACDSGLFAAIAPVAGTLMGECGAPRPTSVLHIHGLADSNVPFDGSRGDGYAAVDGAPVEATVDMWRRVNRCDPPTTAVDGDVTFATATCPAGRAVDLITIADAGHQWPGSHGKLVAERVLGVDPPSPTLDATGTIWRFFRDHPRPP